MISKIIRSTCLKLWKLSFQIGSRWLIFFQGLLQCFFGNFKHLLRILEAYFDFLEFSKNLEMFLKSILPYNFEKSRKFVSNIVGNVVDMRGSDQSDGWSITIGLTVWTYVLVKVSGKSKQFWPFKYVNPTAQKHIIILIFVQWSAHS